MPRKYFHPLPVSQCRRKDARTNVGSDGYVLEYCPEHPRAARAGQAGRSGKVYQRQHQIVVEEYLGRELEENELVHHCDHDKQNNWLENLDISLRSPHMRHHGKVWHKSKPLNDPDCIETVRKAAENKELSKNEFLKTFPYSLSTVNRILAKYKIRWKSPFFHFDLDPEHVEKVLQSHSRQEALRILGCSTQFLWNRFPEAMRKTATRKLKSYREKNPK